MKKLVVKVSKVFHWADFTIFSFYSPKARNYLNNFSVFLKKLINFALTESS